MQGVQCRQVVDLGPLALHFAQDQAPGRNRCKGVVRRMYNHVPNNSDFHVRCQGQPFIPVDDIAQTAPIVSPTRQS